jgi:hypothetical protein
MLIWRWLLAMAIGFGDGYISVGFCPLILLSAVGEHIDSPLHLHFVNYQLSFSSFPNCQLSTILSLLFPTVNCQLLKMASPLSVPLVV